MARYLIKHRDKFTFTSTLTFRPKQSNLFRVLMVSLGLCIGLTCRRLETCFPNPSTIRVLQVKCINCRGSVIPKST
jgi:hypothetical protein